MNQSDQTISDGRIGDPDSFTIAGGDVDSPLPRETARLVSVPIPGYVYDLCRHLREVQTPVEKILWEALRSRRLGGYRFRRQHPIGRFIVDFYCPEKALIVELDGLGHLEPEQVTFDDEREEYLAQSRRQVIRFSNRSVQDDLVNVLKTILDRLALSHPLV